MIPILYIPTMMQSVAAVGNGTMTLMKSYFTVMSGDNYHQGKVFSAENLVMSSDI